jgi:hypothetical protein
MSRATLLLEHYSCFHSYYYLRTRTHSLIHSLTHSLTLVVLPQLTHFLQPCHRHHLGPLIWWETYHRLARRRRPSWRKKWSRPATRRCPSVVICYSLTATLPLLHCHCHCHTFILTRMFIVELSLHFHSACCTITAYHCCIAVATGGYLTFIDLTSLYHYPAV